MPNQIVINTGPLIALGKMEQSIGLMCIDERKGRQAAVAAGLQSVAMRRNY